MGDIKIKLQEKRIRIEPNRALQGAKLAAVGRIEYQSILKRTHHISLGADSEFMDSFVGNMHFP